MGCMGRIGAQDCSAQCSCSPYPHIQSAASLEKCNNLSPSPLTHRPAPDMLENPMLRKRYPPVGVQILGNARPLRNQRTQMQQLGNAWLNFGECFWERKAQSGN